MAEPARQFEPNFLLKLFTNPLDPGYADAAAARVARGPRPPGARRLALALRVLALALAGFLLAVAYREAVAAAPERTKAHEGLVAQAQTAQARTDELQQRSDELRREVNVQREAALGGPNAELRRLHEQEAASGLAPVTGGGAVVRLTDAPAQIDPTTGKASAGEVSRVLDVDLQSVVNGLWAQGAEAIAINGQRLTATATIRTAGTAVLVDFRPVTSPYEITAIGPDDLAERYRTSAAAARMRALADQYGLGFSVDDAADLNLPSAANPALRYAHPVPGDDP